MDGACASSVTGVEDAAIPEALACAGGAVSPPPRKSGKKRIRPSVSEEYCLCGYGDGEMLFCESGDKHCVGNHWYHQECLGMQQSKVPRGEWWCPDCKERASAKQSQKSTAKAAGRKSARVSNSRLVLADETSHVLEPTAGRRVLTTSSLVKVEAAERQSRKAMEDLLINARLLSFSDIGQVVQTGQPASFPHGLCLFHLSEENHTAMQSLHRIIVQRLTADNRLTPWAGVAESDARKRGYAFLPACYGHFGKSALQGAGVHFHAAEKTYHAAKKDEAANWNSCVRLSVTDITEAHIAALRAVIAAVRAAVPERYRSCVSMDRLQALQPNLHHGLDHLPVHLDSPLHDGFGVVIVTVCVHQGGQILLVPSDDSAQPIKPYVFNAAEGDVYVLSGDARNIFDHGVICEIEKRAAIARKQFGEEAPQQRGKQRGRPSGKKRRPANVGRESLNLRFSIHGTKPGTDFYVGDEIPIQIDT